MASINGDGYSGVSGVPVFRPDATDYRPKWGLYRGINSALYRRHELGRGSQRSCRLVSAGRLQFERRRRRNDYALWRNTMGQTGAGLAADGNGNYRIDTGDYQVWRTYFGRTLGGGTASAEISASIPAAVPEPATAVLIGGAVSALRRWREKVVVPGVTAIYADCSRGRALKRGGPIGGRLAATISCAIRSALN